MKKFKENKKRNLVIVLFIIFIMVTSVIGFLAINTNNSEETSVKTYNGFDFYPSREGYAVSLDDQYVYFDYFPGDLENITLPYPFITEKVYLAFKSSDTINELTLSKIGYGLLKKGKKIIKACIDENDCTEDIPIVDCTNKNTVLYLSKSPTEFGFFTNGSCLIFKGDDEGLNRLAERFLYSSAGVMKSQKLYRKKQE